jgi:alkylhydroperoxidase/carboxymuconolactone decarboxylase family protein YurZ
MILVNLSDALEASLCRHDACAKLGGEIIRNEVRSTVMPTKKLPRPVEAFRGDYAEVWQAFTELGDRCHHAGPLDARTRRLVKLALAVGAGLEGATHSAVRNALAEGITAEEVKQVAILSITTAGFPSAMRALTWIGDCLPPEDDSTGAGG